MKIQDRIIRIVDYPLVVFKTIGLLIVGGVQTGTVFVAYVIFDVLYEIYRKLQENQQQDLSNKNTKQLLQNQKALENQREEDAKRFERYEGEQKSFQDKLLSQKTSVGLLNRLINEGFIREGDLLKLPASSSYYQVIVYSVPVTKLVRHLADFKNPKRRYPIFLQGLGFVRMGKTGNTYLLNKQFLNEPKLRDNAAEFKRFLKNRLKTIRQEEWREFLGLLEEADRDTYNDLKNAKCISKKVLQINFLLTEMNINMTNMGYVDGEVIGIADAKNDRKLSEQILANAYPANLALSDDVKIKIRKVMREVEVGFLLDEVAQADRRKLSANQDEIKQRAGVDSIIGFHASNLDDLKGALEEAGISEDKAVSIADQLMSKSKVYSEALRELGISLE